MYTQALNNSEPEDRTIEDAGRAAQFQARIDADLKEAKALKPSIKKAEDEEPRPAPPIDHSDEGGVI